MTQSITSQQASDRLSAMLTERLEAPTFCWGMSWGYPTLDKLTGGIHDGELATLIARSGVGKSALAGKIALAVARQFRDEGVGKVVRIVSLEMDAPSYQRRMACFISGVPATLIRAGFPGVPEDTKRRMITAYKGALEELATLPMQYVEDEVTLDTVEKFINSTKNGDQCGFWVLDHIGIVPGINDQYAAQSISAMYHRVRKICRYTAPGLVLSQMNRDADKRQDKRPRMSDAFGSHAAEADSNVMLGLYREAIYLDVPMDKRSDKQPAELSLLKQREGLQGTIHMIFDPTRVDYIEDAELNSEK